jgi:hypothetical protein
VVVIGGESDLVVAVGLDERLFVSQEDFLLCVGGVAGEGVGAILNTT